MTHDAIFSRLPHAHPMLFLDRVLEVRDPTILTETTFGEDFVLADEGKISPLVCLELFAQSAAALMAHRSAAAAAQAVSGALLGTRKFECFVETFRPGDTLRTEAREIFGAGALAQFECKSWLGETLVAEGSINVAGQIGPPR